ncbi:hypothetical protein [Nocardia nova]|uniref:hypothetical protein n=1 Tax=Nocardia nova TaxID=37330 RepID=UPI00273931B6|nr:hypothetical protein [Nocardia nova]
MMFGFGETVTVTRPAAKDRNGDPTGPDTTFTIDGCGINYQSTSDNTDHRETTLSWIELLCPPGADIRSTDKVQLPNGRTYNVDGDPAPWKNPFTGWEPGVVARLKGVF